MSLFNGNEVFYCQHCENSILDKYDKECSNCGENFPKGAWFEAKFIIPYPTVPWWKFWKRQYYKSEFDTQRICDKLLNSR